MKAEELVVGCVVVDPSAPVPPNKAYFVVRYVTDPEIGPWILEQVAGRRARTIHLPAIERLTLAPSDTLVGKHVRLHLRFSGSTVSGTFECVEYTEYFFDPENTMRQVPVSFTLDGEVYPIATIERLEVL